MATTALIIEIPEAEPVVGELRRLFDPTALQGVPAHVTVLVPFIDGAAIQTSDIDRLKWLFEEVREFRYAFRRVARFPDATYLAPEDASPFVKLTQAVVAAFPEYPPYGGAFPEVIPHLTVAHGLTSGLDEAAERVQAWAIAGQSIFGKCREVLLLEQCGNSWQALQRFQLASSDA